MTVNEIAEQMCSYYCKWPLIYDEDEEQIPLAESEICENCPLNKLMEGEQ